MMMDKCKGKPFTSLLKLSAFIKSGLSQNYFICESPRTEVWSYCLLG